MNIRNPEHQNTDDEPDFDEKIPTYSTELVKRLDAIYPHQCLAPGESVEIHHRYAGRRELIDELISWVKESTEESDS